MNSRNEELIQALLNGKTLTDFAPCSRAESYLKACINKTGTEGLPTPQSRMDVLLLELASQLSNTTHTNNIASIVDKSVTTITAEDLSGATQIGDYAFYGLNKLTSIEIPNTVISIGNRAFGYCSALTNIIIPENIAEIKSYAFRYCTALNDITIKSLTIAIGAEAFNIGSESNKLTIRMLATTPPSIEANSFNTTTLNQIIVPVGCAETYKAATNWSNFASYIVEATN